MATCWILKRWWGRRWLRRCILRWMTVAGDCMAGREMNLNGGWQREADA